MEHRIETLADKLLIGKSLYTSYKNDQTRVLWQSFGPLIASIKNRVEPNLFSMQDFEGIDVAKDLTFETMFKKWAAVEVTSIENIPDGLESIELKGGLYVVFLYKGGPAGAAAAFQYIFQTWVPQSKYVLDDRIHFELIGPKYKNNSEDSEEEIWIPIREK
ncbi:MAG: GyrI-like domain-containing protein [Bacteroidia bacterium]|nr:GyrI-like domain-containing protein [Bacteroidia bacterium]MCF8425147.1 GyrI-like domain-containing protein [Bacteroidia bacterium]MCF8447251.1 GyrI-like domain-containing protein [Bacteroidia bacterium]